MNYLVFDRKCQNNDAEMGFIFFLSPEYPPLMVCCKISQVNLVFHSYKNDRF